MLFCDVRSFTTFSEHHTPREVVRLLNTYFGVVVPILEEEGGIVNQYIGDGLMVMFGAPERQTDHALRAARAAVRMVMAVNSLRERWKELDKLGGATSRTLWQRFDAALKTAYLPVVAHLAIVTDKLL